MSIEQSEDDLALLRGDTIEDSDDEEIVLSNTSSEEEILEDDDLELEPTIPKSRLDEVLSQREEARERSAWLEAQLEKLIASQTQVTAKAKESIPAYDFAVAEEAYASLLAEAEYSKAAKLRLEIDGNRKAELLQLISGIKDESKVEVEKQASVAVEKAEYRALISTLEKTYPYLDVDSKSYNEEAVDTINTLSAGFVAAGLSRIDAMKKAVAKANSLYKLEEAAPKLGEKRTTDAGRKAVKAAQQQPPKGKTSATKEVDLSTVNVSKLSDKEFAKLTKEELRMLRGD